MNTSGVVQGYPVVVDRFQYRSGVSSFFLSHLHADHVLGLSSTWDLGTVYCSPVTRRLLLNKYPSFDRDRVVPLQVGETHLIFLDPDDSVPLNVTLFDAGHCPGSSMFLFEGNNGRVLHTGDFRYNPSMLDHPVFLESDGSRKSVDWLYLDNTYADSQNENPSRADAANVAFDIISAYPGHQVLLGIHTLGKEELALALGLAFGTKVCVSDERMKNIEVLDLPHAAEVFATDPSQGFIRVVPQHTLTIKKLKNMNETVPTIGIIPTGWGKRFSHLPRVPRHLENSEQHQKDLLYWVPYSLHSSQSELREFVQVIRPKRLSFIVEREAHDIDMFADLMSHDDLDMKPTLRVRGLSSAPPQRTRARTRARMAQASSKNSDQSPHKLPVASAMGGSSRLRRTATHTRHSSAPDPVFDGKSDGGGTADARWADEGPIGESNNMPRPSLQEVKCIPAHPEGDWWTAAGGKDGGTSDNAAENEDGSCESSPGQDVQLTGDDMPPIGQSGGAADLSSDLHSSLPWHTQAPDTTEIASLGHLVGDLVESLVSHSASLPLPPASATTPSASALVITATTPSTQEVCGLLTDLQQDPGGDRRVVDAVDVAQREYADQKTGQEKKTGQRHPLPSDPLDALLDGILAANDHGTQMDVDHPINGDVTEEENITREGGAVIVTTTSERQLHLRNGDGLLSEEKEGSKTVALDATVVDDCEPEEPPWISRAPRPRRRLPAWSGGGILTDATIPSKDGREHEQGRPPLSPPLTLKHNVSKDVVLPTEEARDAMPIDHGSGSETGGLGAPSIRREGLVRDASPLQLQPHPKRPKKSNSSGPAVPRAKEQAGMGRAQRGKKKPKTPKGGVSAARVKALLRQSGFIKPRKKKKQ